MTYLEAGCRALLGVVFLVSAGGKLAGRRAFADFARSLAGLVPARWRWTTAAALTAAEVAVVVLLAAGATAGLWLAAATLVVLTAGVVVAVRRGTGAPCRCFGRSDRPLRWWHGVRNAVLAAVAAAGAAAAGPPGHPAGLAVALLTGAVAAVLVVRLDDLLDLFAPEPVRTRS